MVRVIWNRGSEELCGVCVCVSVCVCGVCVCV